MKITRQEFDKMLGDPDLDLNPAARGILQAYAQHMNYGSKPVSAYKTMAQAGVFAGIGKDQAAKHIKALVKDGFLIDSGDTATGPNRKPMPKYYLGRGVPTHSLIMRPKGRNPKNLGKDNSEPLGVEFETGPNHSELTTPNDEVDNSERRGSQVRTVRNKQPVNNQLNNPSNNQEGADAPEPQTDEPDGSSYPEGTAEDFKNFKKDDQPSYLSEEPGSALSPRTEDTPTPNGSELSYEEQAEAGGFGQKYNDYLKVPGLSKKRAFEKAKEDYERNVA